MQTLSKTEAQELQECVRKLHALEAINVMTIVERGRQFNKAKKILKRTFQKWLAAEFPQYSYSTVVNWMNVARTVDEHPEWILSMENLTFRVLYKACSTQVPNKVKEAVFALAQSQPVSEQTYSTLKSLKDESDITQAYRELVLRKANLDEDTVSSLKRLPISEDKREVERISSLSKPQRDLVVPLLEQNMDTKSALKLLRHRKELCSSLTTPSVSSFSSTVINGHWLSSIPQLPTDSFNLSICECPLSFEWFSDNIKHLCPQLNRILVDGGLAFIILGHKAIGWAGEAVKPLNFLHVLTLRRRPGFTSFIPGINIAIASLPIALCYKGKYSPPPSMIVDLHTFDIESGIEAGFLAILSSLNLHDSSVALINISKSPFNLERMIIDNASNLKIKSLFCLIQKD